MSAEVPPEGAIQLPVVWVGADDLPVHHVNQFVTTVSPTEVFMTIGTLVPPPLMGSSPEERLEQAKRLDFVQIRPVARVAMTEQSARDLMRILKQTLDNYEKMSSTQ